MVAANNTGRLGAQAAQDAARQQEAGLDNPVDVRRRNPQCAADI